MFTLILNIFKVKVPILLVYNMYATPYFLFFGKNKIRQHYSLSVYVSQENPLPVLRLTTIIRSTSLLYRT